MPLLLNPGPTNVAQQVKEQLTRADTNHREPAFVHTLHELRHGLTALLGEGSAQYTCIPMFCSGTGINEAVLHSIGPSNVLAISAGRYGKRLAKIARQVGHNTREIEFAPFEPMDLDAIEQVLITHKDIDILLFAHHETTSTVLAPINQLCALAQRYGVKTLADTISSVYGHVIDFSCHGPDFFTLTANKCLESVPGISFLFAKKEHLPALEGRTSSFYFDVYAHWTRYENGDGLPRFTLPTNVIQAAHTACERLKKETVAGRFSRYLALKRTVTSIMCENGYRVFNTGSLNTASMMQMFQLPADTDFHALQRYLRSRQIIIYTDSLNLSEKRFFIATMGAITNTMIEEFDEAMSAYHCSAMAT